MRRLTLSLLIGLLIISYRLNSQSTPIQTEKKIALVIGNGNYASSSILANPENDARAMKTALQSVGFTVLDYENLNQSQMKKAIDEFGEELKNYDIGLFFYAGHGIQCKGYNYLIPVDADLKSEQQVEYDCVQADRVLALMEASGSKVNILILDACRNNPFERSWTRAASGKGLAFMNAPSGTLIAYATSPGSTASDGSGRNGLYTSAILESIQIPNISIIQMFQNVRGIVSQKSGKQQIPWESTSLTGDFYFNFKPVTEIADIDTTPIVPLVRFPTISDFEVYDISSSESTYRGSVLSDGGGDLFARGLCWSTNSDPTTSDSKTIDGNGLGSFSGKITNLTPGKTYFVRGYAINSAGTQYSKQVSFSTLPIKPIIYSGITKATSPTTAVSGGTISKDEVQILQRGVCWDTIPNPTIEKNKTLDGDGTGAFTSNITGLSSNTTYYLRAYGTSNLEVTYGDEITFKTLESGQVVDIDGNVYNSLVFGDQTWMLENLKTTKYNDGTPIPLIIDKISWRNGSSAYCWYDNQESYKVTYGALYNWSSVQTGKLCPIGWHVPDNDEWGILINLFGGDNYAGNLLKNSKGQQSTSIVTKMTYYSGISALPAGMRDENGEFDKIGDMGYWWSSSKTKNSSSWCRYLGFPVNAIVYRKSFEEKPVGLSVRCIKD